MRSIGHAVIAGFVATMVAAGYTPTATLAASAIARYDSAGVYLLGTGNKMFPMHLRETENTTRHAEQRAPVSSWRSKC